MKIAFLLLAGFIYYHAAAQTEAASFDPETWQPPYTLNTPEGWGVERFPLPPSFAPSIPFSGVEDIRFTPGWAKATTDEYWSYAFLWYLDKIEKISASALENSLQAYYAGLYTINKKETKPEPANRNTEVEIKKIKTSGDERETFSGTVSMPDYMSGEIIALNLRIHVLDSAGHSYVFFEVSPQPYGNMVWQDLDALWGNFVP